MNQQQKTRQQHKAKPSFRDGDAFERPSILPPWKFLNIADDAPFPCAQIPNLREQPLGLCTNILRSHFSDKTYARPWGDNSQEWGKELAWGGPFTMAAMKRWPKMLASLTPHFVRAPEDGFPYKKGAEPKLSYIPGGYFDHKDLWFAHMGLRPERLPVPKDGWEAARTRLLANSPHCRAGEGVEWAATITYFAAELEQTLETPIRRVLDHVLSSVYEEETKVSPWLNTNAVIWLARGTGGDRLVLTRRVAAALGYSEGEFAHFLNCVRTNTVGGSELWPVDHWLPKACFRWVCYRLQGL